MEALSLNTYSRASPLLIPSFPRRASSYSKLCCATRHRRPPFLSLSLSLIPPPRKSQTALRSISVLVLCGARHLRSWLRGGLSDAEYEAFGRECLHGGGIATVLMSTTAAAAARAQRVSPFLGALAQNPTFVLGLAAWALAQTMKVLLNFFVEWRWDFGLLFECGGMPSSHSALCMALTSSVALCHGVGGALFPVCLGCSLLVRYDAIGVRRHAGMQAEVLNKIIEDLFQGHPISQKKLKELLGHTPSQVIAGALLGISVACFCCQGCTVAI